MQTGNPYEADQGAGPQSISVAEERRTRYLQSLPADLLRQEDAIQRALSLENASAFTKLRKIYWLIGQLVEAADGFVACRRGCSDCCRMNVQISKLEADYIARERGVRPRDLLAGVHHHLDDFNGVSCPFLAEGECSIYQVRPYACRKHLCFDNTAYWCAPGRSAQQGMPLIEFSGLQAAFFDVTRFQAGAVFADIRDFFPQNA